ncbi:GntR family transcriptional regulator [Opitutales bacterium]|nr:GntR family transcriptional regulator [Opitutales bacterium]
MSLVTRIKDEIGSRLERSEDLQIPLTVQGLSEHYGVSYTPVREAIGELIGVGLIRKKSNGRLEAVPPNKRTKKSNFLTKQKSEKKPVENITKELVEISLGGEECFVREEATASKHGLTRSTLRQILQRLAGEGLLEHVPRRGWRVKPFRQEDMDAFIEVREVMELKALDLAKAKLPSPESQRKLRQIKENNQLANGKKGQAKIDNSLHAYFIDLAANPYINDFFNRHGRYFTILFNWEGENEKAAAEAVSQHHEIIDALLAQNWSLAKKRLSHHLHSNHPVLRDLRGIQNKG